MERKIVFGLFLIAFVLLFGVVFSIAGDIVAKQHFLDVAKQKENNFKVFGQSDNLLPVLKKFKGIGQGAILVQDAVAGRFFIIQESSGARDFEIYAGVTETIVNNNLMLTSQYITSKTYPFVLLDCYHGWEVFGTDYTVPVTVWDSDADLKLDGITVSCKNVGGKDFDYLITQAYEFSSFLSDLKKTNIVGYPFVEAAPVTPIIPGPVDSCSSITDCMVKIDKSFLGVGGIFK